MTNTPTIITFGCRLNAYESEVIRAHVEAAGLGEVVIVNTCAVTGEAERQARQAIRKAKREHPDAKIIVTGCAAQINPEKYAEIPEVDCVIGNKEKMWAQTYEALRKEGEIPPEADLKQDVLVQGFEGLARAFVQVQNGCDNRCTYCVIPYGRGASRSVRVDRVIEQARALVDQGYNEIVLTGVDITSYGKDLEEKTTLGGMIRRVLESVPVPWLRLSSIDPAEIDDDLWQLIANEPRLLPHLHLSLQSGDDMILKRMKRRHTAEDVRQLCRRARECRPDIVFGADIIAGFPTEDEAMFANTLKLVEEADFLWLHVFPYSARAGTPAAKMPQVKGDVRRARAAKLRALGARAVERHLAALTGKKLDVLVEQAGVGRTRNFASFKIPKDLPVGKVVAIECVGYEGEIGIARAL